MSGYCYYYFHHYIISRRFLSSSLYIRVPNKSILSSIQTLEELLKSYVVFFVPICYFMVTGHNNNDVHKTTSITQNRKTYVLLNEKRLVCEEALIFLPFQISCIFVALIINILKIVF